MTHRAFCFLFLAVTSSAGTIQLGERTYHYEIQGGFAITQGDIILGTAVEVEAAAAEQAQGKSGAHSSAVLIPAGNARLWPDATMYYTIDPDVPNQQRLHDAVKHWNDRTSFKILPRTSEANYVRFQRNTSSSATCSSSIGQRGGEQ